MDDESVLNARQKANSDKKIANMKITMRDNSYSCGIGMRVIINEKNYMVIITTNTGLCLIDKDKNIIQMKWDEWQKAKKCESKDNFCVWDSTVIKKMNKIIKEIKRKNIKREPLTKKIVRTPVMKIVRTPMKKKIIRTPITKGR